MKPAPTGYCTSAVGGYETRPYRLLHIGVGGYETRLNGETLFMGTRKRKESLNYVVIAYNSSENFIILLNFPVCLKR